MSRIDCSLTENFLKEFKRATNSCESCAACLISKAFPNEIDCVDSIMNHPHEAISIIQEWSDAHPIKTRLDDVKEKYPNVDINNLTINLRPAPLGYCKNCYKCLNKQSGDPFKCWNEPLEGGATGG